jgi:acyl-CoA thioester hydrolase
MPAKRIFRIELESRDYECDLQGIINNAVYLNYFEHTRHRFLESIGFEFSELHRRGTDPVVRRIEIDYRRSLKGGERFLSLLEVEWVGKLQMLFRQSIVSPEDRELIAESLNYVTFVKDGRPIRRPAAIEEAVDRWWAS